MTTSRIIATEIAWPVEVVAGQNDVIYRIEHDADGIQTFTVTVPPGKYYIHKLQTGMPNDLLTQIASLIQTASTYTTTVQRGLNGLNQSPAIRFVHGTVPISYAEFRVFEAGFTLPLKYLGMTVSGSGAAMPNWSDHPPAGSFLVVDQAYSTLYRNTRIVEWRPRQKYDLSFSSTGKAPKMVSHDFRWEADLEYSGLAAPFARRDLFNHAPSVTSAFGNTNLQGASGISLDDLWYDADINVNDSYPLRFWLQLDNASAKRQWWGKCRFRNEQFQDQSAWRADEPGYAGERYRSRLNIWTEQLVAII